MILTAEPAHVKTVVHQPFSKWDPGPPAVQDHARVVVKSGCLGRPDPPSQGFSEYLFRTVGIHSLPKSPVILTYTEIENCYGTEQRAH